MRVGFDVRPALREKTGVGRYLFGLLPALVDEGVDVVAFSASWKDRLPRGAFPGVKTVDRRIPVRLLDWAWERHGAPPIEALAGALELVHSPTPLPLPSRAPSIVTVHDLFFVRRPDVVDPQTRRWIGRLRESLLGAAAVICVSETTARAVRDFLSPTELQIDVIHHGLERPWLEGGTGAGADDHPGDAETPYLLAVGALEVRKNYARLLSAFDRLRRAGLQRMRLVIAGPDGRDGDNVRTLLARLDLEGSVELAGYQDDDGLRRLYRGATALVMPSLDEGFGFPILEAMASACPIVAANAGALPEVAGDAAVYVDPLDEESIVEGLTAVVRKKALRESLREAGLRRATSFTWSDTARRTASVYRRALAAPSP